jgi:hypothetical protein
MAAGDFRMAQVVRPAHEGAVSCAGVNATSRAFCQTTSRPVAAVEKFELQYYPNESKIQKNHGPDGPRRTPESS